MGMIEITEETAESIKIYIKVKVNLEGRSQTDWWEDKILDALIPKSNSLEKLAKKAATTGNRKDLQEYLKARSIKRRNDG